MDEKKGKGFTVDHAIMIVVALIPVVGGLIVRNACSSEHQTPVAQPEPAPAPAPPMPVEPPPPAQPPAPEAEKTEPAPRAEKHGTSKHKTAEHEKASDVDQGLHIGSIVGNPMINNNSPGSTMINEGPLPPQLLQEKVDRNHKVSDGVYVTRIEVRIVSAYPPASIITEVQGGRSITAVNLFPVGGGAVMVMSSGVNSAGGSVEISSPHGSYALLVTSKEPENDLDVKWGFGQ
jgi:hypothetical protein